MRRASTPSTRLNVPRYSSGTLENLGATNYVGADQLFAATCSQQSPVPVIPLARRSLIKESRELAGQFTVLSRVQLGDATRTKVEYMLPLAESRIYGGKFRHARTSSSDSYK